ncbi:lysylphosphatidylglycerol synthase domain-containing protein [Winogradskyella sp. 3972H.M.0a.05]|uniref:lysylphosphatidylglycerol synthase domain-containing protein n=1 Tax=Winogradskyella sp. 3972H.M.0a.05 TaxID=2950277 RepID=UPI00339A0070
MFHTLPYKTKQFFFVLIKLSIVVGAFYFIYQKLAENEGLEFSTFIHFLTENRVFSLKNVVFLLVFTLFNWFFEILKWQHLVASIKKISLRASLEQSLGSLTASLITPNRIGEYGAKAVYYSKTHRKRILLLNLVGNVSQMTITMILGTIGFAFFVNNYDINIDYYKLVRFVFVVIVIGALGLLGIKQDRFRIKGFSFEKVLKFIKAISAKTKATVLLLSLIRYLIFSYQFYFLLTIFGVEVDYLRAMMVITSMYLLASIIPSIFIFDVVIKGSVAVYLFSAVGVNEISVLSIISIMWLLNIVLPSIFGSYYVLNFNFKSFHEE